MHGQGRSSIKSSSVRSTDGFSKIVNACETYGRPAGSASVTLASSLAAPLFDALNSAPHARALTSRRIRSCHCPAAALSSSVSVEPATGGAMPLKSSRYALSVRCLSGAATVCSCCATTAPSSCAEKLRFTCCSAPDEFCTFANSVALSPSKKTGGVFISAKNGSFVTIPAVISPTNISRVTPRLMKRHSVVESGSVTVTVALPFASVTMREFQ